jgi:uncharacterized membrane protein
MNTASSIDQLTFNSASPSQSSRTDRLDKFPIIGFVLFLLINGVLFIRPMDIFARLENWPIYELLSIVCLLVSFQAVLGQFRSIFERPITACVLGLLLAILLSHVSHLHLRAAAQSVIEFSKVVIYYLLLVSVVSSPRRLRWFLICVTFFACVHIGMAVLQHRRIIDLPAMRPVEEQQQAKENGEILSHYRMCGAGLFHDPNDLAVLTGVTMLLCLYPLLEPQEWQNKGWWLLASFSFCGLLICGYGLYLTESRGGFLALITGAAIFSLLRFGLWKSILLGAIALPAILFLFSGRQTDIHMMRRTTAQLRMGFWIQGIELFKHSPIFGIGQGNFLKVAGKVVHNSFLQSFTELGFFGGTLFLGAFFLAWWPIFLLSPRDINDSQLARLQPYLLAMLTTWIVGMMSLTRSYVPPTYMMLGLATVYLVLSGEEQPRLGSRLVMQLVGLSLIFLAGVFVFVHVFHRGS